MLQNVLQNPPIDTQCEQCNEMANEVDRLHQSLEALQFAHLAKEQSVNLKKELNALKNMNQELVEENQSLQNQLLMYQEHQQNEEQLVCSLKTTVQAKDTSVFKLPEFMNCLRSVDLYIKEQFARQHFTKLLEELAKQIDNQMNASPIQMMYDRLLIKYYQLMKAEGKSKSEHNESAYEAQLQWAIPNNKRLSQGTPKKNTENTVSM